MIEQGGVRLDRRARQRSLAQLARGTVAVRQVGKAQIRPHPPSLSAAAAGRLSIDLHLLFRKYSGEHLNLSRGRCISRLILPDGLGAVLLFKIYADRCGCWVWCRRRLGGFDLTRERWLNCWAFGCNSLEVFIC